MTSIPSTPGSSDEGAQRTAGVLQFTPTVIVALDPFGRRVAERIASLVRAHLNGQSPAGSQALRERIAFLEVEEPTDQFTARSPANVNAIRLEYSAELWRLNEQYTQPAFNAQPERAALNVVFANAVRQVLGYVDSREILRQIGVTIRPSVLQVFIVGSLFSFDESMTFDAVMGEYLARAIQQPATDLRSATQQAIGQMSERIGFKLDSMRTVATIVRTWAGEAAALSGVLRGGFLAVPLPDNTGLANDVIGRHGSTIGALLEAPSAQATVNAGIPSAGRAGAGARRAAIERIISDRDGSTRHNETLLHFLSLHQAYDESAAYYDVEQLSRAVAGAIYGLTTSELLDTDSGRFQLGLQEAMATPYDRLVTIAASRSSFPTADLLDYAALRYGAYLIGRLVPDDAPNAAQRNQLQAWISHELRFPELQRMLGSSADLAAQRRQSRRALLIQQTEPPNLRRLIALPRFNPLEPWSRLTRRAFAQVDDLVQALQQIQHELDAGGIATVFADPARTVTLQRARRADTDLGDEILEQRVGDFALLREWHGWSERMQQFFRDDARDVGWRTARLRTLIDEHFWGQLPGVLGDRGDDPAVPVAVVPAMLDVVDAEVEAMANTIATGDPDGDDDERAARRAIESLNRLRSDAYLSLRRRVEPSYVLLLALLLAVIFGYGLLSLPPTAPPVVRELVNQPALRWQNVPWGIDVTVPMALVYGAVPGVVVWLIGNLVSLVQSALIWRRLERYVAAVRLAYRGYLVADERRGLNSIPEYLQEMATYLRMVHSSHRAATHAPQTGAIARLHARAQQVASHGFRDLTEYSPIPGSGVMAFYTDQLESRFPAWAANDLAQLRVLAGAATRANPYSASEENASLLAGEALQRIDRVIVGDPASSDAQPQATCVRHLAYPPVRAAISAYVASELAQHLVARAPLLVGDRTPLLLQLAARESQLTYEQRYLISNLIAVRRDPAFRDAQAVASLDREMIMYLRLVARVWPRLFADASITLALNQP